MTRGEEVFHRLGNEPENLDLPIHLITERRYIQGMDTPHLFSHKAGWRRDGHRWVGPGNRGIFSSAMNSPTSMFHHVLLLMLVMLVTILGTLPNPNLGEVLKISGSWKNHSRYGEQFKFESFEVVLPSDVEGIRKYLESGAVRGIGSKTATRLVDHFREHTFHIIEHEPQKLMEVKGIGSSLTAQISISWKKHHTMRDLIRYLQDNGIKTSHCAKLFKLYGSDTVSIIQEDPYRLVDDLPGIGFHIADAVLRNSHEPMDESRRTRACLQYLLQQI